MALDEVKITQAIVESFTKKLEEALEVDVAIVGAGPSGLTAAYKLGREGFRVAVFERKLSIGGGMWGGGMMFNEIVVQEEGARILREVGVEVRPWKEEYYTADAVECVCALGLAARKAGAKIFNLVSVEDVMVREDRVVGLVINWTAVEMGGLHVDPLAIRARYVVESTGHELSVLHVLQRKMNVKLFTPSGKIEGERSLWAEVAETTTLENTREVYPGMFVAGMAANATFGSFRMGPIFGGMLLSGEKVAQEIAERLRQEK
ncbi:thiazole biosynthesis protein [Thermosulfurimonas marina]|uniref:Thiamine thiazole synthase n=1 Tax=Thermosulfurimonas marina TaxID=2047767 RepID=A0A6H1WUK5_9BACT|nr:sulfide-dependent adenosine diphosphate thiazole synthase [Thermosulfurimonas marina]QJA06868.1 thiazole biosynthesis protein [Thermosulfurimonas marina]